MKIRKLALKRVAAWLMAAAMVTSSVDITTLTVSAAEDTQEVVEIVVSEAVESTGTTDGAMENAGATVENTTEAEMTIELPVETVELSEIETSAQAISFWALDNSGKVALKSGNYANWIDRIDATGADYVTTFYNWLVSNSNPTTAVTNPESAALFEPTGTNTGEVLLIDTNNDGVNDGYVYQVVELTGSDTFDYVAGSAENGDAAYAAIQDDLAGNFAEACAHITGVYSAFDRDHPEIFWLSGGSVMSYQASMRISSNGTVTYTQPIYFVLKSDSFDIREDIYQDNDTLQTAINETLVQNDSDRATILAGVPEDADIYETVQYFNQWLTQNNCYNSDVNNAGHDARECTSALSGSTGTTGPVCEAYARAFKVLCDAKGIPCVLVDGSADNGSGEPEAHMWNYVQMDDEKWYAVDVTWNDPTVSGVTSAVSGAENENYFLVGSDTEIGGMSFIESHPVSNTVTLNGASFTNGPKLEASEYVYEDGQLTSLTVAGEPVDLEHHHYGAGWNYNYETQTLTLTANLTGDIVSTGSFAIALGSGYLIEGNINVTNGDLIFSGDGQLRVNGSSTSNGNINIANGDLIVDGTGCLYIDRAITADAINISDNMHFAAKKGLSVKPVIEGVYHWRSTSGYFDAYGAEITEGSYESYFESVGRTHLDIAPSTAEDSSYLHKLSCKDSTCLLKMTAMEYHAPDKNNHYICSVEGCGTKPVALVVGGSGENAYEVPVYYFYGSDSQVEEPAITDGALVWAESGDTIKLLQNITVASSKIMNFQSKGAYSVDLNGYTLDATATPFNLTDGSTVAIAGEGTFITTGADANISAAGDFAGYVKTTQDSTTTVYGQVPLTANLVIAEGETYNLVNGAKLVLGGYTVTNNGTILVDGVLHVHNNNGAVSSCTTVDDANHLKVAACLDCPIGHINSSGMNEAHTYVNGVCSLCEQVCSHASITDGKCDNCQKGFLAGVTDGTTTSHYMSLAEAVNDANTREAETILNIYEDCEGNLEIDRYVNDAENDQILYINLNGHTLTGDLTINRGAVEVRLTGRVCGNIVGGSNGLIYLDNNGTVDGTVTSNGGMVYLNDAALDADTNIVLNDGAQIVTMVVLSTTTRITVKAPEGVVVVPWSDSINLYTWNYVSVDGYTSVKNNDGSISFVCEHNNKDYAVENATISAKCSVCKDDLGSLTLNGPADLLYDGTAKEAAVTGEIIGLDTPKIVYSGENLADGKPVNAGDYTATITWDNTSVSVEFTIEAISLESAAIADIPNQTYDGDDITPESVVTLEDKTLVKDADYTVSYEDNLNAGTANITVEGKGNYKGTIYKSFVIEQADAPVITWPTASDLVYGQTLAESILTGGSIEYGTFVWEDATILPKTGERVYNVVFTPTELVVQNYKNMAVTRQEVTVVVAKADPTYTIPANLTAQYGQTLNQVTLPVGWSWDTPEVSVGNAGNSEFAATYTPEDTDNYNVVQKNLSVKVEPIALSVSGATVESRFYDGTNVVKITEVTLSGVLSGDEVFVSLEGLTGTVSSAEAGDYNEVLLPRLTLSGAAAANYTLIQPTEAFPTSVSIRKSNATITLKTDVYRKIYGDDAFLITGDITTVGDTKLVYSVSNGLDSKGNSKDVDDIVTVSEAGLVTILGSGSVTVTLSMEETANYYAVSKTISIQVMAWDDIPQNGFFIKSMDVETYTGKAIKPEPAVYDGNSEICLEKGRDYTISYKNNKNAYTLKEGEVGFNPKKAPTLIIKGKGNYDKTLTVYFTIQPKDISDETDKSIEADDIVVEVNGKAQKKVPVVKFNNKKLGKADYLVTYPAEGAAAYVEPGIYPVVITGKGNFTGSRTVNLIVTEKGASLAKATIAKIPAQEFDGVNAVELDETELVVTAKVNGKKETLKKGVHYTVEYANNEAIGTATVTVKAIAGSGFAGFKKATFKITGVSIAKATVEGIENKIYTGSAQELALKVSLGGALVEGKDYTVTYVKNVNVGIATVTIKGIGKYTGSIKKSFKITAANIADLVTVKDGEMTAKYLKGGSKPSLNLVFNEKSLQEGKDYIVTYKNNKAVYTAKTGETGYDVKKAPTVIIKGKGNFAGTVSRTFTITARELIDTDVEVTITVADKAVSTKKGGYISKVVITDADGKVLKQGVDYSAPVYALLNEKGETVPLTKEDTAPAGSVIIVSVTGMGAYAADEDEMLSTTYRITAKDFTKAKVKSIQKKYTGKNVELTAEDFLNEDGTSKVTIGGENLVYGRDFEIVPGSYKNNLKKGTASVTIRGMGEYGGTKTVKFSVGARSLWFWWL